MGDEVLGAGRELDARVHAQLFRQPSGAEGVVPHYSTDLGDSFRVVEALQREGYRVDVSYWGDQPCVTVTSPLDDPRTFTAATPAVALCLAALAVTNDLV